MQSPELPSLASLFWQAACKRTLKQSLPTLPGILFEANHVVIDPIHMQAYHQVIGWQEQHGIAPTYLQVMAFKLHLQLLTCRDFPFASMGLVHLTNRIEQFTALTTDMPFTLSCHAENLRSHKKGWLFDVVTIASVDNNRVWKSTSGNLFRCQNSMPAEGKKAHSEQEVESSSLIAQLNLPSSTGRRYARVSGDYNPIHLWPLTAKLLGFPRHIAHGMWSKARCLSALSETEMGSCITQACIIDVEFKRPLLLPARVNLVAGSHQHNLQFALQDPSGKSLHLRGKITPL